MKTQLLSIGGASPATASTAVTVGASGLGGARAIAIDATLAGTDGVATGGTLDVYVQCSEDGAVWVDYCHFAQVASGAAAVSYRYVPALTGTITVVGIGTLAAPGVALAAGNYSNGPWGDYLRVVFVAGAGTNHAVNQTVLVTALYP